VDETPFANRAGLALAIAALVAVLVAIFALVDTGPFADEELTTEEFIAEGDEICTSAHDEFREIQQKPPRTPSDAAEQTGGLIDVAEEERDALADLNEPSGLSEQVDRYLEARDRGIDLLREGRDAAEAADPSAYERFQAEIAATQLDPRYEIAREIGFSECSKPLIERGELKEHAEEPTPTDTSAPPTVSNPPTGAP
jgi:hypothetical protein